jgi:hypothetical protein
MGGAWPEGLRCSLIAAKSLSFAAWQAIQSNSGGDAMTTITTIVRAGRIQLDEPSDLPDGSPVEVTFRPATTIQSPFGMTEQEQGTTPEAIERWIAILDAIPAPVMTDEEWSAWNARRKEDREWEFANEAAREAKLRGTLP